MKFLTAAGIEQVLWRLHDSKKCYSRSQELVEMALELPQVMEVEKTSRGPMETNIDPRLQEDELIVGPMEELT